MNRQRTISTEIIRRRYNRLAFFYNLMEWPLEKGRFEGWCSRLRGKIIGPRVLEIGVGTGKNMPYYPCEASITAIDFSPNMLVRAQRNARRLKLPVNLLQMDAQQLGFPDAFFDTIFATFVFCSVPDPLQGLAELRRVCRPDGRLLLLEHMRPANPVLGMLFDLLNPVTVRITGANINRRTLENLKTTGWRLLSVDNLSSDIVRWIEAAP
jgi:ubiquinone/menaquinone biosynthesis C-methylase UbiE